jgi:hypothetical protein
MSRQLYLAPQLTGFGSFAELTAQIVPIGSGRFDKDGSAADFLTPTNPLLDGFIVPDPD